MQVPKKVKDKVNKAAKQIKNHVDKYGRNVKKANL